MTAVQSEMTAVRVETDNVPAWARCAGACWGENPVMGRFYFASGWMLFLCRACGGKYLAG